ncbi:MAG: YHYH protein [Pseudomonadota bacterium]
MRKMMTVSILAVLCAAGNASAHDHHSHTTPGAALEKIKSWFEADAIVSGPHLVDCTLSGGSKTKCFSITLKPEPSGVKTGPWCPRHVSDGPDKSGIWLHAGKVYDADGAFIKNLPNLYRDKRWQMFDPATGKVRVTDSKQSCEAAARPDVDPKYRNHCVECQTSYMKSGATMTYVIPLRPVPVAKPEPRVGRIGVGISFNGAKLEAPAPVDAILRAHTLAPFDDCGGHVNLHVGYHIHAVTDCLKQIKSTAAHAPLIGIAMDGYPLYARLDADGKKPAGLDRCRGHATDGLGYHYHVAHPGENAILGCHKGETGCVFEGGAQPCDATLWGGIRRRIRHWLR